MSDDDTTARLRFLAGLRLRFPDIRPYGEDDWDWTWADEGMEALEARNFGQAALMFQRLIAAQPEHGDGYEGLALVYQTLGWKAEAVVLIEEALRLARRHLARDVVDPEVVEQIERERAEILAMRDGEAPAAATEEDWDPSQTDTSELDLPRMT